MNDKHLGEIFYLVRINEVTWFYWVD